MCNESHQKPGDTAARMFHAKKTQRIICTGTQHWRAAENDLHFREEATQILVGLGIPTDRIEQLEGKNTSQEMQNLQLWIQQQPNPCLLYTSPSPRDATLSRMPSSA